jgi:hypothetical protein
MNWREIERGETKWPDDPRNKTHRRPQERKVQNGVNKSRIEMRG